LRRSKINKYLSRWEHQVADVGDVIDVLLWSAHTIQRICCEIRSTPLLFFNCNSVRMLKQDSWRTRVILDILTKNIGHGSGGRKRIQPTPITRTEVNKLKVKWKPRLFRRPQLSVKLCREDSLGLTLNPLKCYSMPFSKSFPPILLSYRCKSPRLHFWHRIESYNDHVESIFYEVLKILGFLKRTTCSEFNYSSSD